MTDQTVTETGRTEAQPRSPKPVLTTLAAVIQAAFTIEDEIVSSADVAQRAIHVLTILLENYDLSPRLSRTLILPEANAATRRFLDESALLRSGGGRE
jgi:hypothetical protein